MASSLLWACIKSDTIYKVLILDTVMKNNIPIVIHNRCIETRLKNIANWEVPEEVKKIKIIKENLLGYI
ncbi:hypothetical protein GYA25_02415 [Candidatus Woesearchaeota archaeon]|nr:hypothetical protein [Candidatus Woesearchaeota archaeon]